MLILLWKEIEQDQGDLFKGTCFSRSQIHQLKIMYHFKHTNHDILLNILSQNLYKLFLRGCNLLQ